MNNTTSYANSFLSRKFVPYRGLGNTCPVCSSHSGKCKAQEYELSAKNGKTTPTIKTLCMSGTGGYGNPDYHYFSDTRDGQWGVYIPLADWNEHRGESCQATPIEREEWILNHQLKQQAALEAENKKRAESLPIAERDIAARAILIQLSLNDVDRKDLLRRGFTAEQIKKIGFKSIDPFQKLRETVNPRFPGVGVQGDRLNNHSMGGILIPIYTIAGEIVGFQIRNREPGKNRYRWLSSAWEWGRTNGNAPNLINGELPLTYVYPRLLGAEIGAREISLAEGTGAKPNIAAIELGQQVIGAAGGQFLSSSEQLQDGLTCWRAEIVNLLLDGDDPKKPQVVRRWVKLYHQLAEWGYKPRLMWSGKDIDELDDITDLRELTLQELGQKAGIELIPTTSSELGRASVEQPISMARKLYHRAKKFTANSIQHNRYLQWEIPETLKNTLIGIKSALGTGKTEILKSLGAWSKEHELELNFIGYRNNLLRQTCDRIPDLMHIGDEDKVILLSDYHKALCHHSAGMLDSTLMQNRILVLDEIDSILRDMLTTKLTAGRNPDGTDSRQTRLAHIKDLIVNAYAVVVLDGYLSDTEMDFIQELRSFDRVYKIENTYKNNMDVRMVDKKSTATREVIDFAIANQGCILVTATTQKFCENLDKSLIRAGIEKEDIHRFDGSTDRTESSISFFDHPGNYIEKHKPRVLLLSPTAESGISIDLKGYFITHYHFHIGNLGLLSGLQFLGRYRDFSAPRVIYCEQQGMIDEGNSSSFSKWVKDEFDYRVQIDLDLVVTLLGEGKNNEAIQILKAHQQKEDSWVKLSHKYKAIHNHEMQHLKELFIEQMQNDGYTVTIDGEDDLGCADTEDLMGAVEMERQVIHSTRLYNAPTIDKRAYEAIKNNLTANESDRLAASKYYTTQIQLPGIMQTDSWSPELVQMVKFGKPKLIQQLENFYYLLNPDLAKINHIAAWMPVVQTNSDWMPDQVNRSRLALINCGCELELEALLDRELSMGDLDEIVAKIAASKLYQSALKVKIEPLKLPSSFKWLQKHLKKLGIKFSKSGDFFIATAMKDSVGKYSSAPKYDALTPELIERVRQLSGGEFIGDNKIIQELGKAIEALEILDGRGRMCLVASAARYLGIKVTTKRHRTKNSKDEQIALRIYIFSDLPGPISDAIKDTHIRPTSRPVEFAHIYECVEKRLKELGIRQQERIQEWQNTQTIGLELPTYIDDFANAQVILPPRLFGLLEFELGNLRHMAEELLRIGQSKMDEDLQAYLLMLDPELLSVAAQMVKSKYPQVFEQLKHIILRN